MDSAIVLAILGGIVTVVTGLVAFLQNGWRKAAEREATAKDKHLAFVLDQLAVSVADRRNLEQRLQFFMETMKDTTDGFERSVALTEKLYERLVRPAGARTRANDEHRP